VAALEWTKAPEGDLIAMVDAAFDQFEAALRLL
jgi:hypothetical protein